MEWEPAARVEVVKLALPLVSATVASTTVPSLKVAEPVGVPPVDDFTVAVKVTRLPCFEGLGEEARLVELAALLTTKCTIVELPPVKFPFP
jgi:hypothetical protein